MRIQHNIMAMNAYRNYNTNTSALSKNLEKLSSGYKINRAGDDAAGLAISEKMRAQITGLEVAQKNAKDGISLVQTAEGALTEVHDMLNRMVELANQSANGTYEDTTDRNQLQKEVDQLRSEINRIADSANFNGINLLDGSMEQGGSVDGTQYDITVENVETAGVTASTAQFTIDLDGLTATNTGTQPGNVTYTIDVGGTTFTLTVTAASGATVTAGDIADGTLSATSVVINGITYGVTNNGSALEFTTTFTPTSDANLIKGLEVSVTANAGADMEAPGTINTGAQIISTGAVEVAGKEAVANFNLTKDMIDSGVSITIGGTIYTFDPNSDTAVTGTSIGIKDLLGDDGKLEAANLEEAVNRFTQAAGTNAEFSVGHSGSGVIKLQSKTTATGDYSTEDALKEAITVSGPAVSGKGLTLQIGDTSDPFNKLTVSIKDCHVDSLKIDEIDISNQAGAQAAVDKIKDAINYISDVRGTLGATQNRLDHTINNLSVMTENIQDAESTIRDTDVAEEMMAYTKNNILIQSAQAMLAQANQVPQGVLQLLQ